MPYSYIDTVASAGQDTLNAPPYMQQAHVNVRVDGVVLATSAWVWNTSTQIGLVTPLVGGEEVRVYRTTPAADPVVVFQPGTITHSQLNLQITQALYIIQEAYDLALLSSDVLDQSQENLAAAQVILANITSRQTTIEGWYDTIFPLAAAISTLGAIDTDITAVAAIAAQIVTVATAFAGNTVDAVLDMTFTPSFTGATSTAPRTLLEYEVVPEAFGAVGDGVADDTAAITAAIAALSVGTIEGRPRRRVLKLGAGVYRFTSTLSIALADVDLTIRGAGPEQTVLMADFANGNAIELGAGGDVIVEGFALRASVTRQGGAVDISRSGIVVDAGTTVTAYRYRFINIYVVDQPGHGFLIYNPELLEMTTCIGNDNGMDGCRLYGRNLAGISNELRRCRFKANGQYGLYVNNLANSVCENCQALNNGTSVQMFFDTSDSWTVIEPDCEAFDLVTGATAYIGLSFSGRRHKVIGGTFYGTNTGIRLSNADDAVVLYPKLTGKSGAAMATGISIQSTSDNCLVVVGAAVSDVTTLVDNQGVGNLILDNGAMTLSRFGIRTISASPTTSYTPDLTLGSVFVLTLTGPLTINTPTGLVNGKTVEFVFIQDATGGRNVTFNSSYRATFSNTGNTASLRSGVTFRSLGVSTLAQMGAQGPWA